MADHNSVVLLGRLARDPELQVAPGGSAVCTFSVATNQHYAKDGGQKAQSVTFVDVTVWSRLAELCTQFLRKGREVLVSGSLKQDRWVDAKTQQPRSKIKVVAREVMFIGPRAQDAPAGAPQPEASERETSEASVEAPSIQVRRGGPMGSSQAFDGGGKGDGGRPATAVPAASTPLSRCDPEELVP